MNDPCGTFVTRSGPQEVLSNNNSASEVPPRTRHFTFTHLFDAVGALLLPIEQARKLRPREVR